MPKLGTLRDTFATRDTSRWRWGPDAAVSDGRLILAVNSAYRGNVVADVLHDLTESELVLELGPRANGSAGQTIIQVYVDGQFDVNAVQWVRSGSTLRAHRRVAGNLSQLSSVTYDPVAHKWLRISEAAGTVTWATSPDAVTWTTQASWAETIPLGSVGLWMAAGIGSGSDPTPVTIDNINPATTTGGPAWSLWDGATEQPLTLAGVWDGTAVQSVTFDSIT